MSPCTIKSERRQDALVPSERPVAGVAVTLWSSPAGEPNWDLLRLVRTENLSVVMLPEARLECDGDHNET